MGLTIRSLWGRLFARRRASLRRRSTLRVEPLEDRATPAAISLPWADPRHLTLSFVNDGTNVLGHPSDLFASMNAALPATTWQRDILRAFQTWAALGNLNIAVESEQPATPGGTDWFALGTAGARQGDPRFGDIRVGAVALSGETLAAATPPDLAAPGTWSGDVLFNDAVRFGRPGRDLYTIALHEAGHALGLTDNTLPFSAMNARLVRRLTTVSRIDVNALVALFGRRSGDQHEGALGNNTMRNAAWLDTSDPVNFRVEAPLVVYGDVTTTRDVDYYAFHPAAGYTGSMTFRLQSAGVSLLAPKISVLDSRGRLLGRAFSTNPMGDTVEVHLAAVDPAATYYIRVEGATHDVFGIGSYGLALIHDLGEAGTGGGKGKGGDDSGGGASGGGGVWTPQRLDAVLRGPYEELSGHELRGLLENEIYEINDDLGSDDNLSTAGNLGASFGYPPNTHYEMIGSFAAATDVDNYRIVSPASFAGATGVLTATVWTMEAHGIAPTITLFGADQQPLAAQVLVNGNGSFTIQAAGVPAGSAFYIEVQPGSAAGLGNYHMTADFGARATSLQTFAAGTLTDVAPVQQYDLYVAKMQLFHMLLSAQGGPVRLTVLDAGGQTVGTLTAPDGLPVSGPGLLLKPGQYRVRLESLGNGTTLPPTVNYSLLGNLLSHPIGPIASDPSTQPQYVNPTDPTQFLYPTGVVSVTPFLFALAAF